MSWERDYIDLEAAPAWLREAVELVMIDIQASGRLTEVTLRAWPGDGDSYMVGVFDRDGSGGASGLGSREEMPRAERLVNVAENIQNELCETAEAWGQARPGCPGHTHPAGPALVEAEAWWICPLTRERLGRIGTGELARRGLTPGQLEVDDGLPVIRVPRGTPAITPGTVRRALEDD